MIAARESQHPPPSYTTLAFVSICHAPPSNHTHGTQLAENEIGDILGKETRT